MSSLFPLFLRLEGRRCVLVGAGSVAAQKIESLLNAGAEVQVVAPDAGTIIGELAADGKVSWIQRDFRGEDLEGAYLVIAATADSTVNGSVSHEARRRGILCNAVDEPENCDFFYPAVVKRGDLQIAISTSGQSPALAQRIRREMEEQFDETYSSWLLWLGALRRRLFRSALDPILRRSVLHRMASREAYQAYVTQRQNNELAK